jgi:hypothetical protein
MDNKRQRWENRVEHKGYNRTKKYRQKPAPCLIEVLRIFSPAGLPNWYVALLKNARMQHGPGPLNVRRNSIYEQREYKYDRALGPFLFLGRFFRSQWQPMTAKQHEAKRHEAEFELNLNSKIE